MIITMNISLIYDFKEKMKMDYFDFYLNSIDFVELCLMMYLVDFEFVYLVYFVEIVEFGYFVEIVDD